MANNGRFTPKKYGTIGTDPTQDQTDVETTAEEQELSASEDQVHNQGDASAPSEDVTMNVSAETKKPVHNVKVRTNCDHRCSIGGVWYDFKKGVQQSVPDEVKTVLLRAGLLMPL